MQDIKPSKLKILFVDDHPIALKAYRAMLEKLGHDIDTASTGQEAIAKAKETPFDVIFMDIVLPDISGLEATVRIREQEEGRKPAYIVALSAYAMEEFKQECYAVGINFVQNKPILGKEMEMLLANIGSKVF